MSDKLPNADKAFVEPAKLNDDLLSPDHRDGKGKAKVFKKFGFSRSQPETMEAALLRHAVTQLVIEVKQSKHGVKCVLECLVATPDKRNPCICSVWIIDAGKTSPRLVTAFPN